MILLLIVRHEQHVHNEYGPARATRTRARPALDERRPVSVIPSGSQWGSTVTRRGPASAGWRQGRHTNERGTCRGQPSPDYAAPARHLLPADPTGPERDVLIRYLVQLCAHRWLLAGMAVGRLGGLRPPHWEYYREYIMIAIFGPQAHKPSKALQTA